MNLEKKIARRLLFNYLLWLSKTRVLGGATEKILCLLVCVCLINISGFLTSKVLIELSKQEFLSLKRHYLSLHLGCFHYVISLLCGCVSAREKPAVHCPALKCFHSNLFFFLVCFFLYFVGRGLIFMSAH